MIKYTNYLYLILFLFLSCKKEKPKVITLDTNLLHAQRGVNPGIYDSEGRYILLRGANYNVLGDYWQGNAALPTTKEYDIADFKMMAAQGFNCVRLIISWSKLEPTKGNINLDYINEIKKVSNDATVNGLYVLLDMHQDSWGKYIVSPSNNSCEFPNKGWDGAPQWATIFGGASTCTLDGSRETAPAVYHSFQNFWDNTDGIQDAFINTWSELVKATADNEMILGYDIINEPSLGYKPLNEELLRMGKFYDKTIKAIRNTEKANNFPEHIAFFEMGISWNGNPIPSTVPAISISDQNLVFAPHNYFESITYLLTIEQGYEFTRAINNQYKTHLFMGEWGFFGDPAADVEKMKRFAAAEDKYLYSSTFWQWSQSPGDPHGVNYDGSTSQDKSLALIELDKNALFTGIKNDYFLNVLARNRPLAIVGQPKKFISNTDNGQMILEAQNSNIGTTTLWLNDRYGTPIINGENIKLDKLETVEGGYIAHVSVENMDYKINIQY